MSPSKCVEKELQQKHGAVSGLEAVFRRRFPGTHFEYNTMNFNRL